MQRLTLSDLWKRPGGTATQRLTLAAAGFFCALMLLFGPSIASAAQASAAKRQCNGTLVGKVVGDVVVPPGGSCLLDGATVTGDVTVGADAWAHAQSATINGDYTCDRCRFAHLYDSIVGGNYRISEATQENQIIGSVISGTLRLKGNDAFITVDGNHVGRDLTLDGNTGDSSIVDNTISGNLQCRDNVPPPASTGNTAKNFKGQCSTAGFGTAARGEHDALSTAFDITEFLKEKLKELQKEAGGQLLDWASTELLNTIFSGGSIDELEEIKGLLVEIQKTQLEMLKELKDLLQEVQFQSLVSESHAAVETITSIYEQLVDLSQITNQGQREREAARIQGQLLPSSGSDNLFTAMKTISDVLLGIDPIGNNPPLIKVFADRWFDKYTAKQFDAGVPLRTYPDELDAWLRGLFIIQYMGMAERATGRIANGDFEVLAIELDTTIKRMDQQSQLLAQHIPSWTRTLPDALYGRWNVVWAHELISGKIVVTNVMYGSPAAGSFLDWTVQFRSRHALNGDEEWALEKRPVPADKPDDVFFLRERSRANYVSLQDIRVVMCCNLPKAGLRILMGRTNDPAVPATAPRRDLYVPVIGFVDNQHIPDVDTRRQQLGLHRSARESGAGRVLARRPLTDHGLKYGLLHHETGGYNNEKASFKLRACFHRGQHWSGCFARRFSRVRRVKNSTAVPGWATARYDSRWWKPPGDFQGCGGEVGRGLQECQRELGCHDRIWLGRFGHGVLCQG